MVLSYMSVQSYDAHIKQTIHYARVKFLFLRTFEIVCLLCTTLEGNTYSLYWKMSNIYCRRRHYVHSSLNPNSKLTITLILNKITPTFSLFYWALNGGNQTFFIVFFCQSCVGRNKKSVRVRTLKKRWGCRECSTLKQKYTHPDCNEIQSRYR